MNNLAVSGGKPVRIKMFPANITIGQEEKNAVNRVLESGILSKYLGSHHENFMGGPEVRALEEEWAEYFDVKHAIAVNSATSGLYCAVGAIGIEPGDEVIVPPFTMSATVMAPIIYGGMPVFVDIESDYFCIDPEKIREKITSKTRAIMCVDLFGHPCNYNEIKKIAAENDLKIIEDCSQSPGAKYDGRIAGTISDIGVFSLNYHKHIQCGEGGIIVTNNDSFAERLSLIRNHAEAVVEEKKIEDLTNMVGFNFRMTEIEATIARCQLQKLEEFNSIRIENANYISNKLRDIPAITVPRVSPSCKHVYYVHACKFNKGLAEISRNTYINAVKAELMPFEKRESEGVKLNSGYVNPLNKLPLFKKKIAFGSKGYPFVKEQQSYFDSEYEVAESMQENELFIHEFILPSMTKVDMDDVADAFYKVWDKRSYL